MMYDDICLCEYHLMMIYVCVCMHDNFVLILKKTGRTFIVLSRISVICV